MGVRVSAKEGVSCREEVWAGQCSHSMASSRFEEENQRLLELNQRCQFAASATMQWLDIRLQLMGAAVVSAIAGIALVQHQQGLANPGATPGPCGLTSEACYSSSPSTTMTSPFTAKDFHLLTRVPCEDMLSFSRPPFQSWGR